MLELKDKLSSGNLADFTANMRRQLGLEVHSFIHWGDAIGRVPEMEGAHILIRSADKAGFFEQGQAPTEEQLRGMSFDEAADLGEKVLDLFIEWNKRRVITKEEKKS